MLDMGQFDWPHFRFGKVFEEFWNDPFHARDWLSRHLLPWIRA